MYCDRFLHKTTDNVTAVEHTVQAFWTRTTIEKKTHAGSCVWVDVMVWGQFVRAASVLMECAKMCLKLKRKELKGQFTSKSKIHIFPLTCSAISQYRLFWFELPSFEREILAREISAFSQI